MNSSIRYLFIANAISGFAQGLSMLAIPWYFSKSGQSVFFNTSYGLVTLLVIFWGLYAGTLVDKYNRKNVFLLLNLFCGSAFLLIASGSYAGLYITGEYLYNVLMVSVFAITMFNYNIHYPALYALGQEITEAKSYGRFNSRIEIIGQSVSILSGGLAALLLDGTGQNSSFSLDSFSILSGITIAPWSLDKIIMLNAFSHFFAVLFIIPVQYQPTANRIYDSLWSRLKTGFNYLRQYPKVAWFGMSSYLVFAMLLVEIHAVLPVYISNHLKSKGAVFAAADGIYAVGALSAGLFVRKVFKPASVVNSILFLTLVTVLFFIINSLTKSIAVTLLMSVILGFTNAGIRVLRLTWLFENVENEVMGRVNSIFNMVNVLIRFIFIGFFTMGWFHHEGNMRWAYSVMAGVMALGAFIIYKQKS